MKRLILVLFSLILNQATAQSDTISWMSPKAWSINDSEVTDAELVGFGRFILYNYDTLQTGTDTTTRVHYKAHPIRIYTQEVAWTGQGSLQFWSGNKPEWWEVRDKYIIEHYKFILVDAWNERWYLVPIEFNAKNLKKWKNGGYNKK